MRFLLAALGLIVVVAGAEIFIPRAVQRPAPRFGYPPAPTAAEESGVAETDVAQVLLASPRPYRQVQPPDPASIRRGSLGVSLRTRPAPAQGGGTASAPLPPAEVRDDVARPLTGHRRIRDLEEGGGASSSDTHRAATEPAAQPSSPQADAAVRAPVVTPPALLTPVASYPMEAYRVVLDRTILTPRLRVEAAQGRVMLRLLVYADGSVGSVEVVESSGILVLDQAAVRQASAWKFAPATRDGQPIEAWTLISVRFVVP